MRPATLHSGVDILNRSGHRPRLTSSWADDHARRRWFLGALLLSVWLALPASAQVEGVDNLPGFSAALQTLSQEVGHAVVQVLVVGYGPPPGASPSTAALLSSRRGSGSGVILDPAGYIVTNAHVVAGARRVQVQLAGEQDDDSVRRSILRARGKLVGARIVGVDRETDLAVLKIDGTDLPYLELADSDELNQGELVLAFGSPMGMRNSVSIGVVSSLARQLRQEDPMIYIQTDAAINPGNSGGPLVNTRGQVVGINTMILSMSGGSDGIGFAAPSNIVRTIFEQIRATGRVRRGQLGVRAQTITPTLAAGLGLERIWGVVLSDVFPDGPADRAGLKIGDVVLTLDGKVMENGRQLEVHVYGRKVGERVTVEVLRGSDQRSIRVEVTERPRSPKGFGELVSPERNLIAELGILALDLDQDLARMLAPLRRRTGVVVASMAADAPFWEGGFAAGDIIHEFNGRQITSLDNLRAALAQLGPGDPVVIQVERRQEMVYVEFVLE